jgi:pSer/pThr/pTyr-binding forkhead associated (FHA) protein
VLYLFLLLVARAAWRGLRATGGTSEIRPSKTLVIMDPARSRRQRGETLSVFPGATVGREPGNAIIVDEDTVSARHAQFGIERGRWWLEDLGSTNGTFINRRPLEGRQPLTEGDEVQFGRVAMRFGGQDGSRPA